MFSLAAGRRGRWRGRFAFVYLSVCFCLSLLGLVRAAASRPRYINLPLFFLAGRPAARRCSCKRAPRQADESESRPASRPNSAPLDRFPMAPNVIGLAGANQR